MFTVSINGQRTRASWGEEYTKEDGVPFDFRINPDELRMVVFTTDGTRLGQVSDIYYWPINQEHTEFQFMGKMPAEFVDHLNENGAESTYKFMVLANCGDSTSGEEYITYSQSQLDPTKEESAIPMWGITMSGVAPLLGGRNLDIGDISLLRAAAKIEIKLGDALKDKGTTTITEATLKYYNQTGYVLPAGWSQASTTKILDQESCIRVYRHAAVNMPFVVDEKGDYCYIYVTEYDNSNYMGEQNKISLKVDVGGEIREFEDAISFCNYSDGKPVEGSHYNIVRNHIYEFEIRHIAGSNLMLEYHVADWDAEDWGTDDEYKEHDITYPTYLNPIVPTDYLTVGDGQLNNYVIKSKPEMYFGGENNLEAGAFVGYFRITAPKDVQWKPGIMGSKENYRIRVYKKGGEKDGELLFDSGINDMQGNLGACGTDEWFKIMVFPLSGEGAGSTTIQLGVSYYQQWTNQYINLFINGEYNALRWPDSGTNPKIIDIKHIEQVQNSSEE